MQTSKGNVSDCNEGFFGADVVLVGTGFYYEFFTRKIKRSSAGPVASELSLGWVLSGSLGKSIKGFRSALSFS